MFVKVMNVRKSFGEGGSYVEVLRGVNTLISKGEIVVILGPSGSGKSTMLNVIGGLDEINGGEIWVDDNNIGVMSQKKLLLYRRDYLGFIFQFYNLVPNLTVKENIQVCQYLTKQPLEMAELLETLELTEHQNKFPAQLSGGQQQRCAIARALIKNPKLLLCDEPTGALDSQTAKEILILLEKVNKKYGTTMLIVTHNKATKDMAHRVLDLKDGVIRKDYINEVRMSAANIEW